MTENSSNIRLFIGSSSEGRDIARYLAIELPDDYVVKRWDQNIFEPGGHALNSLINAADSVDFAVLIATPDDTTSSRGLSMPAARDNIIFEYGLFAGKIGPERTFLLATENMKLPTDILGITRLSYNQKAADPQSAVTKAAVEIERRAQQLGALRRTDQTYSDDTPSALEKELELLCSNALSQGWSVRSNSDTTLRLESPKKVPYTFTKGSPDSTRTKLREFVAELRSGGLRVNDALRRPSTDSPLQ